MSTTTQTKESRQYFLITNVSSSSPYYQSTSSRSSTSSQEIDLNYESWKLPYSIDDSDLTFDGKPLNMLYEENKWKAEHENTYYSSSSSSSSRSSQEHTSRGRSRQSKHR